MEGSLGKDPWKLIFSFSDSEKLLYVLKLPAGLLSRKKIRFLDFWTCPESKKIAFLEICTFSPKWLPRPNLYAHETRTEILSRTPVSILLYLSPRPQNLRKTSYYGFLA